MALSHSSKRPFATIGRNGLRSWTRSQPIRLSVSRFGSLDKGRRSEKFLQSLSLRLWCSGNRKNSDISEVLQLPLQVLKCLLVVN